MNLTQQILLNNEDVKLLGGPPKKKEMTRVISSNSNSNTQYRVDIDISEGFHDAVKEFERFDDRLMKLTIISADRTIHFFTVYAPQTDRPDAVKDAFWQLLDERTCHVPADDYIIIAGDLTGHVGEKADGNRYRGGKGFRARNEGGERIIDFADTHDLVLLNTRFVK